MLKLDYLARVPSQILITDQAATPQLALHPKSTTPLGCLINQRVAHELDH